MTSTLPTTPEIAEPLTLTGTRIGIEIDGDTIRVATIVKGEVTAIDEFAGQSAFQSWTRKHRIKGKVVVAYSGARTMTRVLDKFPATEEKLYTSVLESLAEDAGGGIASARLGGPAGEGRRYAAVSIVPDTEADYAWRIARLRHASVVSSSLVQLGDGLNLAIRDSAVEMSYVTGGWPQMVRVLNTGGLTDLAGQFASVTGDGRSDLADAFAGRPLRPEVSDLLARYIAALVDEIVKSANWWKAQCSDPIPPTLVVHGPGVRLPGLHERLRASGIGVTMAQLPAGITSGYVHPEAVARSWTAIAAAASDPGDLVSYTHREAETRKERDRSRTRMAVFAAAGLAAAAALAAAIIYPLQTGSRDLHAAKKAMVAAQAEATRLQPVLSVGTYNSTGQSAWTGNASAEPDWSKVDDMIMKSAPAGVQFASLEVTDTGSSVSVALTATGASQAFVNLEAWLSALAKDSRVSNLFSTNATAASGSTAAAGATSFQVQFNLSRTAFNSARPLP